MSGSFFKTVTILLTSDTAEVFEQKLESESFISF